MLTFLLAASMLFLSCTNAADPSHVAGKKNISPSLNGTDLFLPSKAMSDVPNYAIRSRIVDVDIDLFFKSLKAGEIKRLTLNFFEDSKYGVIRKKQTVNSKSGSIIWMGEIPSKPKSFVVLVVSKKGIDGSFNVPHEGLFTVRSLPDKSHIVEEIKRSALR